MWWGKAGCGASLNTLLNLSPLNVFTSGQALKATYKLKREKITHQTGGFFL